MRAALLLALALAAPAAAGELKFHSQSPDMGGLMAPGAPGNPYVLERDGVEIGRPHVAMPWATDPFLAPGSSMNPWVLDEGGDGLDDEGDDE